MLTVEAVSKQADGLPNAYSSVILSDKGESDFPSVLKPVINLIVIPVSVPGEEIENAGSGWQNCRAVVIGHLVELYDRL